MRSTMTAIAFVAALLVMPACGGGEEGGSAESSVLPTDLGSKVSEIAGETADSFARIYAGQLDEQQSQVGTLKSSAATMSDQKLNDLIAAIEGKLAAVTSKLGEIKTADEGSVKAIQGETKKLLAEASKLIGQAQQRLQSLEAG